MDATYIIMYLILGLFGPGAIGAVPGPVCPTGTIAALKPDAVQVKNARGQWVLPASAYECLDNPVLPGRGRDIPNP